MGFPHARTIIEVKRHVTVKKSGQKNEGYRVYLSSDPAITHDKALGFIRRRWAVENKNHHPRDASFGEDKCRCRVRHTAANLSLLRGAVLTLWRRYTPLLPATAFRDRNRKKFASIHKLLTSPQ